MKKRFVFVSFAVVVIALGVWMPEPRVIPVEGATSKDWHKDTFWYEPWGTSVVHKGIDIFAPSGRNVIASTNLLVLYRGTIHKGGNIVLALGPKWRLHYFAHLGRIDPSEGLLVPAGSKIGEVGDSGNAKGKPAHLHFSIVSLLPRLWMMDNSTQGYKKAFYMNPITYFGAGSLTL